jgi:hypothetical protein
MHDKRRIIQIVIAPFTSIEDAPVIYALCDDGSLWRRLDQFGKRWEQVPGIPYHEQKSSND